MIKGIMEGLLVLLAAVVTGAIMAAAGYEQNKDRAATPGPLPAEVVELLEKAQTPTAVATPEPEILEYVNQKEIERFLQARRVETLAAKIVNEVEKPKRAVAVGQLQWIDSFERGRAEAIRTGKPLLVFSTKSFGCAPCERIKRGAFADASTIAWLNDNFTLVKLDDQLLPPGYGARRSYPSIWLRRPNGSGFIWEGNSWIDPSPTGFRAAIEKALR